jgi:hypothetical protein
VTDDAAPNNASARRKRPGQNHPQQVVAPTISHGRHPGRRIFGVLVLLGAVVAVTVLAHGTKADHAAALETKPRVVHYSVGISSCTFVDASRATEDFATGSDTAGRTLVTEIRYPTTSPAKGRVESPGATPARRDGPFPLVVFGPGYETTPDEYSKLLDAWVRAGMVVAAIWFPDTNSLAVARQGNVDTEADIINQPADVGFVTDHLTLASSSGDGCEVVKGLIKKGDVALAGQSDGADTVTALGYESQYAYPGLHYVAVAALSGALLGPVSSASTNHEVAGAPLLVVQSATDRCNPPQESTALYKAIPESDKWFLTLESGDHLPPYTGTADLADFDLVSALTTAFFSEEFAHHRPLAAMAASAKASAGVGVLSSGPAPAFAPLVGEEAACYLS